MRSFDAIRKIITKFSMRAGDSSAESSDAASRLSAVPLATLGDPAAASRAISRTTSASPATPASMSRRQARPPARWNASSGSSREIVATREHDEDVYLALRDAFDAAKRQLEDAARELRGEVKVHAPAIDDTVAGQQNEDS